MNLYSITNEYKRLLDDIAEGNIPEEAIKDTLDSVTDELNSKLDNIACYVKGLNAEAEAIRIEAITLQTRQKAKANESTRLMDYIHDAMITAGKSKLETARCKLSIKLNPEALNVTDTAALITWAQAKYEDLLTYASPTLDKVKIKELVKAGVQVPGCSLTRGERLEVK